MWFDTKIRGSDYREMEEAGLCQHYYEAFAKRMEMAGIKPHHRIAIGVSGGPDSMALCILASHWKRAALHANTRTDDYIDGLVGLVVDHGLRAESAAEATCVQNWVSTLGIQCHIMRCEWPHGLPKQGHLQQVARNARYQILEEACRRYQIGILFVAHHADDQAELFVLRLSRHSGLAGLAGMAFVCQRFYAMPSYYNGAHGYHGILLVRPLLYFTKDDLYRICEEAGQQWVEDPTNQNMAFSRNRIRKLLGDDQSCHFRREVQALIYACRRSRAFLNVTCNHFMEEVVSIDKDFGFAILDVQRLFPLIPNDLCLSTFLVMLLQFISQKHKPLRGRVIKKLLDYICNYPCKTSLTVGGCYICPVPGSKGLKILICFSCDSPQPLLSETFSYQKCCNYEKHYISEEVEEVIEASKSFSHDLSQFESEMPFLHVKNTENLLDEAQRLQLISESTKSRLLSLKKEMSKELDAGLEGDTFEHKQQETSTADISTFEFRSLSFEQSCYFMNRFNVSWGKPRYDKRHEIGTFDAADICFRCQNHNAFTANRCCSCCAISNDRIAWVRHMKEADWKYLSFVSQAQSMEECFSHITTEQEGTTSAQNDTFGRGQKMMSCVEYIIGKAKEALARLKTVPIPARRGLPVLVNAQGTLLGIPSINFKCCPCISVFAAFKPRVPPGRGYTSWI